jgi:mycothione reductase
MLVHVADVARTIRHPRILDDEDEGVSERFTEVFRRRFDVAPATDVDRVSMEDGDTVLELAGENARRKLQADALLVATGKGPEHGSSGRRGWRHPAGRRGFCPDR